LASDDTGYDLIDAGTAVAQDTENSAIVMRTDKLKLEDEFEALELILHGMLYGIFSQ
jgi:hypothetical protein